MMVAITDQDLRQLADHFESMVDALERYRVKLIERSERYKAEGRDPAGYRPVASNLKRIERLQQLLDGEVYDELRGVLDGTGVLASVDEGRWI
jgi:hypothetical protein